MPNNTYPLGLPDDLLDQVRQVAKETGLSLADAMRQSIKLGLPKLKEQLSNQILKPFTAKECRQCWGTPDEEFDRLAAHCASQPAHPPEE